MIIGTDRFVVNGQEVTFAELYAALAELALVEGLTASAAELNVLDGVVAGTVTASKGLVVDSNKRLDTLDITTPKIGGTAVTSTATELNKLDGVPSSMGLVTTHAGTATLDVSIVLKDAAGATLDHVVAGIGYFASVSTGETPVAATITDNGDGCVRQASTGPALVHTNSSGSLQVVGAFTGSGTYYFVFVGPDGRPIVSSELTAN